MNLTTFFGRQILDVFEEFRSSNNVLGYTKIEGDEFLELTEDGFYLHASNGTGEINNCRLYFENRDGYFPSKISSEVILLSVLLYLILKLNSALRLKIYEF